MAVKNRAQFIDLLKGLALVIMIEVHVFNSLLIPEIKTEWWFPILNFINGLVAPAFTFTSGMVFVLSMQKGVEGLRTFGSDFWKRLSRIGFIFLAAYSLHLPYFSFSKIMNNNSYQILKLLYMVDVLQIIATGLLILFFARILIKNESYFYYFCAGASLVVLFVGPLVWNIDFYKHMPLVFATYFNKVNGSQFPIFPWWAFVFVGAFTAKFYITARNGNNEKSFIKQLLVTGIAFAVISHILINFIFSESLKAIIPHPFFFLERLGVIFVLLALCWFYINRKENYSSLLLDVSQQSLLVYWVHLQLIYRELFKGKSLWNIYNDKLNVLEALVVTIILIVIMIIWAKLWSMLKQKKPQIAKWLTWGTIALAIAIFFYR